MTTTLPGWNAAGLALERMQQVLYRLAKDENDQVDRILAALTLLAGAAVVAWPVGRKAPIVVTQASTVARSIWARRSWWLPIGG